MAKTAPKFMRFDPFFLFVALSVFLFVKIMETVSIERSVLKSKPKLDIHTHTLKRHTGSMSGDFVDDKIILNNYMVRMKSEKKLD